MSVRQKLIFFFAMCSLLSIIAVQANASPSEDAGRHINFDNVSRLFPVVLGPGVLPNARTRDGVDIKELVRDICKRYGVKQDELPTEFSIMLSFKVGTNSQVDRSSIHVIKSSGSKVLDIAAIEIVSSLRTALLFPSDQVTVSFELSKGSVRCECFDYFDRPEDAKARMQNLNFLLGMLKFAKKRKNPIYSQLLSQARVTVEGDRVVSRMAFTRDCAGELLREWLGEPSVKKDNCNGEPSRIDLDHLIAGWRTAFSL